MSATELCRYTVIHYKPNKAVNLVVGAVYVAWALAFAVHQLRWRSRSAPGWRWGWVLPGGCIFSGIGYFIRPQIDPCDFKLGTFIGQQMLIILSPWFFIAFNYAIFGRAITATREPRLSWIAPDKVSKIFVWSDVITFWIQGGAGGLQAKQGPLQVWVSRIFLVGVGLQALSYCIFTSLVVTAHARASVGRCRSMSQSQLGADAVRRLRHLFWAFHVTNAFYLVRCTYRVLEYAFGNDSILMKSEGWLIGLDAAPILLALAVWILRYPVATVCLINDGHQENPLETVKMLPEDASAENVPYYPKHVSRDLV